MAPQSNHEKSQHARLQFLERRGFRVFYAFPFFHLPAEVLRFRKKLLPKVCWYRPTLINLPGGPVGEHDLHHNPSTGRWWANPDPLDQDGPGDFESFIEITSQPVRIGDLESMLAAANHIMFDFDTPNGAEEADDSLAAGQFVLAQGELTP